jgi:hypothetical protein
MDTTPGPNGRRSVRRRSAEAAARSTPPARRLLSDDADAGQQVGLGGAGQPLRHRPPALGGQSQAGQVQCAAAGDQQRPAVWVGGGQA